MIGSPPETTGLIGSEADSVVRSLSKRCLHREEFCLFERFGDTGVKSGPMSERKVVNVNLKAKNESITPIII